MADAMAKTQRLNLRLSEEENALIRRAAEASDSSVSEFLLASAREAAARTLADRRRFELDERAWAEFVDRLDRPVSPLKQRLARLLAEPDRFE